MSFATGLALGRWWAKQTRASKLLLALLATLAVAYCTGSGPSEPASSTPQQVDNVAAPAALPDPRDIARGVAVRAVLPLRKAMKDPSSFELEDAYFMADDSACYTYFARNSFNARVRGAAVFANGQLHVSDGDERKFRRAWNKHCQDRPGERLTAYINMFVL